MIQVFEPTLCALAIRHLHQETHYLGPYNGFEGA